MGKTKTMRLILRRTRNKEIISEWKPKEYGKPNAENIGKWREQFNKSISPGGANQHLGTKYRLQCGMEIYNQLTGEVVATYSAPMFETMP